MWSGEKAVGAFASCEMIARRVPGVIESHDGFTNMDSTGEGSENTALGRVL
jgi:hypothetical protein